MNDSFNNLDNRRMGLATLRIEGGAMHPDEVDCHLSDDQYLKQLRAYIKDAGESKETVLCGRKHLRAKI